MFRKIAVPEMRAFLATTLLLACMGHAAAPAHARDAAQKPDPRRICGQLTAVAERMVGLPRMLLHAVSLAESGRWDRAAQASFAWPWTVYAEGRGQFYPTRAAAAAAVHALQRKGVRNIDVGCMQINLMHHGAKLGSVEQALDPVNNVAYAARLLKALRLSEGSWAEAVAHYHSATRAEGRPYWRRVYALWNEERRRDFRVRRAARIAAAQREGRVRAQQQASAAP